MSTSVQRRGSRFQLRVIHRLLPRPFFFTFDADHEARTYGAQLHALLDRGIVPAELLEKPVAKPSASLQSVVRSYLNDASHLTPSDDLLLTTMMPELVGLRISDVTYAWSDRYVRELKVKRGLAPGSIRKRVGALARVIDWHLRSGGEGANPLRSLPSGYSQYSDSDAAAGAEARHDIERDRRLHPGEEEKIRPHLGELALLFEIILATGLRLREAYRLRVDQVDLAARVIRVEGSKAARGRRKPRTVPMLPSLHRALKNAMAGRLGLLLGHWDGRAESMRAVTAHLSRQFTLAFKAAGVADLTEHDLRHEATCRWFEMRRPDGAWIFSDIEICRIMGWSSTRMALRYASLRGEDLAARLAQAGPAEPGA